MQVEHVLDQPIRDDFVHGRAVRDISDKTVEVFTIEYISPDIPGLEMVDTGNDCILEVVTGIFVREGVELEFLRDFEALAFEGGFRRLGPETIKRIHEELEVSWSIIWEIFCLLAAVAKGFGEEVACLNLTEHVVVDAKPNLLRPNQKGDYS